jgi:hypothetical protein
MFKEMSEPGAVWALIFAANPVKDVGVNNGRLMVLVQDDVQPVCQ